MRAIVYKEALPIDHPEALVDIENALSGFERS